MTERSLLMIPGPIEVEPEVLRAVGRAAPSHMDPDFARAFGRALSRMREVFVAPTGQPFVVAGSGTLAMELAVANVIEPGDRAVVVNTGYFSDRMGAILERLGARVEHVGAPVGGAPDLAEVERAVAAEPTKLVTITHVDTSTGVLADVEGCARIARAHGALSAVDGVCATGGERFLQDAWGVDVCSTASQKAIGVPHSAPFVGVSLFLRPMKKCKAGDPARDSGPTRATLEPPRCPDETTLLPRPLASLDRVRARRLGRRARRL